MIDQKFWCNKTVFLTGHTGFKGSWLALCLQRLGANVTGYALAPDTELTLFELAQVKSNMTSIIANICDQTQLKDAVQHHQPDIVLHLAAQSLVRYSYEHPVETYHTNVMGSLHVLEAIRHCSSIKAAVMITSDKCYENVDQHEGYRETDPMGGYDPYSSSKGCNELLVASYRRSYFNTPSSPAIATARAGNVIGGGDWAKDRLIPDVIQGVLNDDAITLRYPDAIRPWQHVLEPLTGYLLLAEQLYTEGHAYAEAWNFGPDENDCKPVKWLVEQLCEGFKRGRWQAESSPPLHEANCLRLNSDKARQRLDWRSHWDLSQTLTSIAQWYLAYEQHHDMRLVTQQQINNHFGLEDLNHD